MPNLTLAIPEELHRKMKQHREFRWSEIVRKTIAEKIEVLELMDKIAKKSKLTQNDVAEISHKVDNEVARKLGLI